MREDSRVKTEKSSWKVKKSQEKKTKKNNRH